MTADRDRPRIGPHLREDVGARVDLHNKPAVEGHTVTVVVVCGFIGCDWSMEIGTAPFEAHRAYLEHLDVHDPDHIAAEPDCEAPELTPAFQCPKCHAVSHQPEDARQGYCGACHEFTGGGLYAGDTAEQIATEQARVDRFMAGGGDR